MKKTLFLATAVLLAIPAFAQNGFYLSTTVGTGMSNVKQGYTFINENGSFVKQTGIMNYNAKIGVGYQFKNWRFQTGLQYGTSGYKLKGSLFSADFDPITPYQQGASEYQLTYNHIGIPVQVGYVILPERKLSIVPQIGIFTSYNLGAHSSMVSQGEQKEHTWSKESFEGQYKRVSIWGTAAIQLEYKLSKRISLIGGPSVQYMINNFNYSPNPSFFKSEQRNYAINFDLGVNIKL